MSGDAFLVDGIAFWRNEGTGSARSANDIEIEDGIILVHVFGEEDVQAFDFATDYRSSSAGRARNIPRGSSTSARIVQSSDALCGSLLSIR